jgi:tRNA threonylcarbamoyl adenosine modification protein YeaZ
VNPATIGAGAPLTGLDGPTPALAVTSSTGVMSVAVGVVDQGRIRDVRSVDLVTERRHAEELGPLLQGLLDEAGLGPADLGRLAVDVGPGRFTGLRVGLATVRGLAFALGLPVVGATSLEILAAQVVDGGPVTAVIDARRREVFQQVFVDGRPSGPARVGRPEALASEARGVVLGDGLDRYRDLYREGTGPDGPVLLEGRHPRAADLLGLAADRPARPGVEVGPVYLRDPDATANIRTRPRQAAGGPPPAGRAALGEVAGR